MSYILAVSLGATFGASYWWVIQRIAQEPQPSAATHQTVNTGDEVGKTENLLAAIPDPAYRQLVAAVIHAFEPKAELSIGTLRSTSDGTRIIDVSVRSSDKSRLTAIDVLNLPGGKKAGIELVDAAESKKRDVQAGSMIICSNTGFDDMAIKKAKRAKIGLISVLRHGDERVKAVIEEVMYLPRYDLHPITFFYDGQHGLPKNMKMHEVRYHGESVDAWLLWRAYKIFFKNPKCLGRKVRATFNLKERTEFEFGDKRIHLDTLAVTFLPHVQWFSQTVRLDATTGIYDYIRGKVRLADGNNSFIIQGVDFDKGTPLPSPPQMDDIGGGLIPGEIDVRIATVKYPLDMGKYSPTIETIVKPEDLVVDWDCIR